MREMLMYKKVIMTNEKWFCVEWRQMGNEALIRPRFALPGLNLSPAALILMNEDF